MSNKLHSATSGDQVAQGFQYAREQAQINNDHAEALHATRVAKRMAPKVINMVLDGKDTRHTLIGPLGVLPSPKDVDDETATLALNAELRQLNAPIIAEIYRASSYDGYDMTHTLRVNSVGGTEVNPSYIAAEKKALSEARASWGGKFPWE